MNKPILIIMGPAASGKSTIAQKLQSDYGYYKVTTYTTRNKRKDEDENSYHFISEDEFIKMADNNEFYEYDIFGGCYYGTKKEHFPYPTVLILTVKGFKSISYDLNCVPIYLEVKKENQIEYLEQRGMTQEEIDKRLKEDEYQKNWLYDDVLFYDNDKDLDTVVYEINQYFKRGSN